MKNLIHIFLLISTIIILFVFAGPSTFPKKEREIKSLINKSQRLLDQGEPQEALKLVKRLESELVKKTKVGDSVASEVYSMIGTCLLKTNYPDKINLAKDYVHQLEQVGCIDDPQIQGHVDYFLATYSIYNQEYEQALSLYQQCLKNYLLTAGRPHVNVALAHSNLGVILNARSNHKAALNHYKLAIEIFSKYYSDHPAQAHPYNNIGLVYADLGRYNESLENYNKALEIRMEFFGSDHYQVAASLVNIGLIETSSGSLDYANQYFLSALKIIEKENNPDYLAAIYNNLGMVCNLQNSQEKARAYFEQALDIEQCIYKYNHSNIVDSYYNIAMTYKDLNPEKARAILFQALSLADTSQVHLGLIYDAIAFTFQHQQEFESARQYYGKAIDRQRDLYKTVHPSIAGIFYNLAELEKDDGNLEKALDFNHQAQQNLAYQPGEDLHKVLSTYELLKILNQEINLEWLSARERQNKGQIFAVLNLCKESFRVINFLRDSYEKKATKQDLISSVYPIFETAIHASKILYEQTGDSSYVDDAFGFAESSKSILLDEAFKKATVSHNMGMSEKIILAERDIELEMTYHEKAYHEILIAGFKETSTEALEISKKIWETHQRKTLLKKEIENNYANYFNTKYDQSIIPVHRIQKELLTADQSLVEYFVGDHSIFLFLLQKDNFEIHQIKRNFPLEVWENRMNREGIYGFYNASLEDRSRQLENQTVCNYTEAGELLFQKLLGPVKDKLTRQLIIIPDGVLGYIPFEALLSKEVPSFGAFQSYPFLIKEHQISYCYTATLLDKMKKKKHQQVTSKTVLAMAPFSRGELLRDESNVTNEPVLMIPESLARLEHSRKEVESIVELLGGEVYLGKDASLITFKKIVSDYRFIHLSTHGKANDRAGEFAFLGFGNGEDRFYEKLYARELYDLSLNADMVVLSACETGVGELERGEGIISMSRAFAYAGAKSIFTTLWQVDEENTKNLIISFYREIKANQNKSAALQKAKLQYLQSQEGKGERMHPFFWAGFVGFGEMGAINN